MNTPTRQSMDRRGSTTPGTAKYYRVDENGQRVEIPPPQNVIVGDLTPSRTQTQVIPSTSPIQGQRTVIQRPAEASKSPNQIVRGSYQQTVPNPINPNQISGQTVIHSPSMNKPHVQGDDVKIECVDKFTGVRYTKHMYPDGTGIKLIKNANGEVVPITTELLNRLSPSNQGPASSATQNVNLLTPPPKAYQNATGNSQAPTVTQSFVYNTGIQGMKKSREIKEAKRTPNTPVQNSFSTQMRNQSLTPNRGSLSSQKINLSPQGSKYSLVNKAKHEGTPNSK